MKNIIAAIMALISVIVFLMGYFIGFENANMPIYDVVVTDYGVHIIYEDGNGYWWEYDSEGAEK